MPDGCRQDVPTLVDALGDLQVVSVHAGAKHSAAVTEGGHVYAWGALCAPLEPGDRSSVWTPAACVPQPTLCPLPGRCVQVVCGHHHTVAVVEGT